MICFSTFNLKTYKWLVLFLNNNYSHILETNKLNNNTNKRNRTEKKKLSEMFKIAPYEAPLIRIIEILKYQMKIYRNISHRKEKKQRFVLRRKNQNIKCMLIAEFRIFACIFIFKTIL
jgi:hypothetical protein